MVIQHVRATGHADRTRLTGRLVSEIIANAGNEVSVSLKCCSELIILSVTTGAFLVEWMRPETTGLDINALKPLRRLSRAFPETGKTK
jgi:hypothetical protein